MKAILALFLTALSLTAQVITTPPRSTGGSSGSTVTNLNATQFSTDSAGAVVIKSGAMVTNLDLTTPGIGVATGTQTKLGAGTASSPTYTFSGDPNTGVFSSAADVLGISVGGTERWDFSSTAFVPTIDNTYDIGNGLVNPRDLTLSRNGSIAGTLSVHGAVTANSGVFTNSLSVGGNNVITIANISDVAAASSWNGVTTVSPSKNAIYDYFHTFDTDDDGLPDKLDLNAAGFVRTTAAGVISSTEISGDATTSGSGVLTLSASGVTATTYGDSTHVGQFTVDAKGRITAASAVAISGAGGTSDNWAASGTTNSTLAGTSYQDSGVFTNGVTFGAGTARGFLMVGDDDNSAAYYLQATNAMTTNIVETQPVAPYPGLLYWTLLSDGTNVLRNATNTLAGLNGILGSSIIESTSISDTAEAASWNGVTTIAPSKNAVYDYVHIADTDDDGLPDKLDLSAAGFVRTTSGGVISSAELSGAVTTSGSGVTTLANNAVATANIANNAVTGAKIAMGSDAQGDILYYDGTDYVRLAAGTSGQVLQTSGAGANPSWANGGGISTGAGGPIFASTNDATVANTTTETSVIGSSGIGTKTLSANYLTAGRTVHVVVRGRVGTKTISPGTLTIKFKLGSTAVWTAALSFPASLANDYAEFVGDITCRSVGASGTVFAQASAMYNDGVTTTVNAPIAANTTTSTIDTTATQVIDVTATWATADPANTITGSISTITDGTGGTLTSTAGSLTANAFVLGAGGADTKVSPGIITDGTSAVTLGVAGTSVGSIGLNNATSGKITLQPATGALGSVATTFPASDTKVPIISQVLTISGPTAARTITVPDANFTAARTDSANTFTGHQTIEGVTSMGATGTGKFVFDTDPLFSPTFTLAGNPALAAGGVGFATTGLIFEGATANTLETLLTVTDPTADRTTTLPDADTFVPIISQVLTISGPTAARTITIPDANFTAARSDAANTFTGTQTITQIDFGNIDTSITRTSAGDISVEGNIVYRAGGTDVPVTDGGTGLSAGTSGGIPYFSASTTIASSAALAANALVIGGGAGVAPSATTTGTGILTFLGTPSSANFAAAITDESGTGLVVLQTDGIRKFSATLGSDDTYSGEVITGLNNSGGVTQWDVVYLNSSSQWVKADANGSSTYPAVGIAVATASTGNAVDVLVRGVFRDDGGTAWTAGGNVYLSTTAGALTQTAPNTTGDKIQVLGTALANHTIYVKLGTDYGTSP